jgi:hypothetical protein
MLSFEVNGHLRREIQQKQIPKFLKRSSSEPNALDFLYPIEQTKPEVFSAMA